MMLLVWWLLGAVVLLALWYGVWKFTDVIERDEQQAYDEYAWNIYIQQLSVTDPALAQQLQWQRHWQKK